jgi:hypothetical protein
MSGKQRTWGQFATPTDVADLLLGFGLRRPADRLLDPSCGDGALLRRAAQWRGWLASDAGGPAGALHGIELDPTAADVAAAIPGAAVRQANFLALDPAAYQPFDAIVGNPPYTRAEWIGRLDSAAGQLALFPEAANPAQNAALLPRELAASLGGRAGLYAYFLIHSLGFLREGGRLGFVVPNGWLDVAYGEALKRFLLDHFRVLAVIESTVERWFAAASVNTCLLILERAADPAARAANRTRFVRLRRPLRELLGQSTDSRRVAAVEDLIARLLPAATRQTDTAAVRVVEQGALAPGERWGVLLRAPEVYLRRPSSAAAPLGEWAVAQRGATSGANDFFYLDEARIARWGIEPEFRRPLLKSLRGARGLRLGSADCRHELLLIPPAARLAGTAVAEYVAWGEATGVASRATCAQRRPWYALYEPPDGPLLLPKGIWQRHLAAIADEPMAVDQQIYRLRPAAGVPPAVAAALLNSVWFALGCELGGRVNLGEGVLWLAAYELRRIVLPDPRVLEPAAAQALAEAFGRLAARPLVDTGEDLDSDARRALDELVFDLLALPAAERAAARSARLDCLTVRRRRARPPEEPQEDAGR